jgi:hypothetical protein
LVHITSEKVHVANSEVAHDFGLLVEFENQRLQKMRENTTLNYSRYIDFLTEALLPLFLSYHERILLPKTQNV